jgi:hypothetical protein
MGHAGAYPFIIAEDADELVASAILLRYLAFASQRARRVQYRPVKVSLDEPRKSERN